jgi:YidC/Oxa1 family membrane protein insertase
MSSRFAIAWLNVVSLLAASLAAAEPMTRDAALAASDRIAIDSPTLRGSISLNGARIDDLVLARYHETVDPLSPVIVLLSPQRSPQSYYAEFGWVAADGSNVDLPGPDTEWRQEGSGKLRVDKSVTLVYDNTEGLVFRRTISIDDKYLFTIKDEVKNVGTVPVTLSAYALVSRHGTPRVLGLYVSHEGLIGAFGDEGLQTASYSEIDFRSGRCDPAPVERARQGV